MYTVEALLNRVRMENTMFRDRMIFATDTRAIVNEYAYEIVVKDELVCEIEERLDDGDLTEDEIKMLMGKPNTLDFLYGCWMKCNSSGLKGADCTIYEAVGRR